MTEEPEYTIAVGSAARRQLTEVLPEAVAAAAWELITRDLKKYPRRVGKPLQGQYAGMWAARRGTYRIRYRIEDKTIKILDIDHRRDAYH